MRIESLDLHGLGVAEALEKTQQNLTWCLANGVDVIDINHGKGYHSSRNFSVIKSEVRKMLKENKTMKESGYKVIYGESTLPLCLTFDEGHTLVVRRGLEHEYLGGARQQERHKQVFSQEGRQDRKATKARNAQHRKRKS